jgi:LPXTG-site transpeptidase (sortase) family protein
MPSNNPLFPTGKQPDNPTAGDFELQGTGAPEAQQKPSKSGRDNAADLIRQKVAEAYGTEPAAKEELKEIKHLEHKPSKHQAYLQQLQAASTSVADIQTKWHQYYAGLPEAEKHEVWREFYADHAQHARYAQFAGQSKQNASATPATQSTPKQQQPKEPVKKSSSAIVSSFQTTQPSKRLRDARSAAQIREGIRDKVSAGGKLQKKHHLQSLFFGLGMGALSLLVVLFGLFNEVVIAPFIQPSRNVSATPIIAGTDSLIGDGTPKVIIPKINVEIPVDYTVPSMAEDVIQQALNSGTVHYPATVRPGEQGNAAIFGHSSNNIFNPGKYKFAFVLLSRLEPGDTFYLTYNGTPYAYRVFQKQVVKPTDTWVLNPVEGKTATAALITCDPPGSTLNRLVVWGEQISPDPNTAVPSEAPQQIQATEDDGLTGAPESLWNRILNTLNPFN